MVIAHYQRPPAFHRRGRAMTLSCSQIDQLKEAYVDGALPAEMRSAIEAHAFGCASCHEKLAVARQVKVGMGGAVKAAIGHPYMSRERVSRIQANIARQTAPGPTLIFRR